MSHTIYCEADIPNSFDELEPGDGVDLVMRTVVEFEILSKDGYLIHIEDLGKCGQTGTLVGFVVEPLQSHIKESIVNLMCTSSQHLPTEAELAMLLPVVQRRRKKGNKDSGVNAYDCNEHREGEEHTGAAKTDSFTLDHSRLSIGDSIDGYCVKTFRWYEAKVVDMKKDDNNDVKLRIHFSGWNAKHDEWIPRESERIAARGSSSSIVLAAAKTASSLVPWWNAEMVLSRTQEKLGYKNGRNSDGQKWPERKKIAVRIEGIEDFCIDYTYANPSLWLIAASGVWYRVAGPLCVCSTVKQKRHSSCDGSTSLHGKYWQHSDNDIPQLGCGGAHKGFPSQRYTEIFTKMCNTFLSSVHVAMCLIDFLPSNSKLSLHSLCDEVAARSNGEVDEIDILQNFQFIAGKQIQTLVCAVVDVFFAALFVILIFNNILSI